MAIRTNRDRLAITAVVAEVAPARINSGLYDVSADGEPRIVTSVGGINPNVRVGDSAFGFEADHIEPAVSTKNPDDRANTSYNVLACIGNEAVVISGDAKGSTGRVTGKHGGVDHVMIDFTPEIMRKMVIGDKVQVWGHGLGLEMTDAPEVKAFNCDPDLLDAMGVTATSGHVHARVARLIPAAIMGSGLGRSTVVRGDYDIQTFDEVMVEKYGLRELRLGDIVAVVDADNSYGRIYRTGAMTIGVVVHGASFVAGHGPGMTTLLTSKTGDIEIEIDRNANLASILKLR